MKARPGVEPAAYEFLAQALIYPEQGFAARMAERLAQLPRPYPWAQAMVDALSAQDLTELQAEHVRLFVNAHDRARCLPYESAQMEGQLLGEAARQVAALYAEWGLEGIAEMPDHAAVELAFAAQLARLRENASDEDFPGSDRRILEETLAGFERDHLRSWLPGLAANLEAAATLPFYQGLASALEEVFGR